MSKALRLLAALLILTTLSCGSGDSKETKQRALVYEGMPKTELLKVLGSPNRIDSTGKIFQTETNEMLTLERWFYDKRTVVVLNDTVKTPNVKAFNSGEAY